MNGQLVAPDGSEMFYEFDWVGQDGQVIFPAGDPVMQYNLSDETEGGSGSPASNALRTSRDDGRLQNHNWSVSQSASLDVAEFKDQAAALATPAKSGLPPIVLLITVWMCMPTASVTIAAKAIFPLILRTNIYVS
ncbi:hypothetical protein QPK14_01350 [Photorhabdus temperata subsp. temperata]